MFSTYLLIALFFHSLCVHGFDPREVSTVPSLFHRRYSLRPRHAGLVTRSPVNSTYSTWNHSTIQAQSVCGDTGATVGITPEAGPNGSNEWLTCGINSTGWKPSYASVTDIVTVDLSDALRQPNSPLQGCRNYLDIIEKYAAKYQLPPILIASICMQESTCRADTQGQGGEQGLMQITQDKCNGAPGGNCKDPDFNIGQGTQFLANKLASNNQNIILTLGEYNGWYQGMTYGEATAAAKSSCCHCQQNLDYIYQTLNGWLQNRNPWQSPRLGEYFNLDACY